MYGSEMLSLKLREDTREKEPNVNLCFEEAWECFITLYTEYKLSGSEYPQIFVIFSFTKLHNEDHHSF